MHTHMHTLCTHTAHVHIGWLSFSDVVDESSVVRIRDESLAQQGRIRIEVACGKVLHVL